MNTIKIFLILILCVLINFSYCQFNGVQKRIYLSKSKNAFSRDIIETSPNNFVLIGLSFDTINNLIENKLTLVGCDKNGILQWRKSYGNNKFTYNQVLGSSCFLIKKSNYLYTIATVVDSNNIQFGVLTKYNFNGDTLWQKKYYENIGSYGIYTSVCSTNDNCFLITGAIQTPSPGFNNHPISALYVLKTDANGNKLWDKKFYRNNLDELPLGSDIIEDNFSKKIIIVGTNNTANYGSSLIMILDSLGNNPIIKANSLYGSSLIDITRTLDGKYIAVGDKGCPDLINGNQTSKSFIVKFDTSAIIDFSKDYDSVSIYNCFTRVTELNNGDLIAYGIYEASSKYTGGYNSLLRLISLDKNGNIKWKKYFDNYTSNHNTDFGFGMIRTLNNEIAFTSHCEQCPEPAPLTFMFYRTDTSYCDMNAIGCYSYSTVGLNKINFLNNEFKIYPNPTINKLIIQKQSGNFCFLEIQNALGQIVLHQKLEEEKTEIDLSGFSKGIYFLRIENGSGSVVKKLIKE